MDQEAAAEGFYDIPGSRVLPPRGRKASRWKAPKDKYARYRVKQQEVGRCPHCGKPCAPYYECNDRRFYKRVMSALRKMVRLGIIHSPKAGWFEAIDGRTSLPLPGRTKPTGLAARKLRDLVLSVAATVPPENVPELAERRTAVPKSQAKRKCRSCGILLGNEKNPVCGWCVDRKRQLAEAGGV